MRITRFVFIFLISFLLLKPLIKSLKSNISKPIILFAQDESKSIILNSDSVYYKQEYPNKINTLLSELSEKFEVRSYSFSNEINNNLNFQYNLSGTDISALLQNINNQYFNQHVGGMIIATDGIYNQGYNPQYQQLDINFPIHFIALGDTLSKPDLFIADVISNNIAFLDNKFPVRIDIGAKYLNDKTFTLSVIHNNTSVYKKEFIIDNENYFQSIDIELTASKKGLQQYTIQLTSLDEENNTTNNSQSFIIDILDTKIKILTLYNSPHPDVAAIQKSLKLNQNIESKQFRINYFKENIRDYNLVILHQLPSVNHSISSLLKEIKDNSIPVLYILGPQTSFNKLNTAQNGLQIVNIKPNFEESQPGYNNQFSIFKISDEHLNIIQGFPPIHTVFGTYRISNSSNVLFHQKIKNITTGNPLIYLSNNNDHKIGYITGEGIWKWRMHNYYKEDNHQVFDKLINNIIQYLSLKVKKEQFVVKVNKSFNQNETVVIKAELYNDNYELVNEPESRIVLKTANNREFDYVFNKTTNAYKLDINNLPAQKYDYIASVKLGKEILSKTGQFIVYEDNIEAGNTVANHKLLNQLARKYKGKVFSNSEIENISRFFTEDNSIKPKILYQKKLNDLINIKALLILLLLFISLEWFFRKYSGSY